MAGSLTIDNINGKVISSSPVATESQVIGVGQTWQDVTASRVLGVTYTNSTGKPIVVNIDQQPNAAYTGFKFFINSTLVAYLAGNTTYSVLPNFTGIIVPNGATYSVSGGTLNKWFELR